jgi:hypothetical protein
VKRKRILRNICEYDYIIDQPTPMSQYPKSTKEAGRSSDTESATFLPKLNNQKGVPAAPVATAPEMFKKKPGVGLTSSTVTSFGSTAYATSTGPFYKKRGYAAS